MPNSFDVPEDRYVLPPTPRFLPGDDQAPPPPNRNIPTVTLYDGKRWEELTGTEKLQYARGGSIPVEQLFYVKLTLLPANALSSIFREFEDVTSVKFEEHWLRIFDKTGDWTFPRERVIEVQTTRQQK